MFPSPFLVTEVTDLSVNNSYNLSMDGNGAFVKTLLQLSQCNCRINIISLFCIYSDISFWKKAF